MLSAPSIDTLTRLFYEYHLREHGENPLSDRLMQGLIIANSLPLMLAHEPAIDEGDVINEQGGLTDSAIRQFDEALADYGQFKRTFKSKGGKIFLPTNEAELPYFEFNPYDQEKPLRARCPLHGRL